MKPSAQTTGQPDILGRIDYRESTRLSGIHGFLVIYEDQCQLVMSAFLTSAEKNQGLQYLLIQAGSSNYESGIYLWDTAPINSPEYQFQVLDRFLKREFHRYMAKFHQIFRVKRLAQMFPPKTCILKITR